MSLRKHAGGEREEEAEEEEEEEMTDHDEIIY